MARARISLFATLTTAAAAPRLTGSSPSSRSSWSMAWTDRARISSTWAWKSMSRVRATVPPGSGWME